MCAKGNPKFSCPTILSHSDDESLGSESDSREEFFDSSLDTVNVSVNTELPMNSSHGSEEEEFDFLHLYEELSDYDFHRMMSVDDFTYVMRRRGRLTPRQPLSVCALLPAPRKEQASTASWKPRPPFEAAEMD